MRDPDIKSQEDTKKTAGTLPTVTQQILFWGIVTIATIGDLWSKSIVFEWLSQKPYQHYVIIPNMLSFILRENGGAAFSIMSGKSLFLITVSSLALIAIVITFYRGMAKGTLMRIVLAMFTAGTIGNLWDRVFNDGFVRDFIDVYIAPFNYHWPTFNIADSLMCVALGIFFIHSIFNKDQR